MIIRKTAIATVPPIMNHFDCTKRAVRRYLSERDLWTWRAISSLLMAGCGMLAGRSFFANATPQLVSGDHKI